MVPEGRCSGRAGQRADIRGLGLAVPPERGRSPVGEHILASGAGPPQLDLVHFGWLAPHEVICTPIITRYEARGY